jgi:hypothetical protein
VISAVEIILILFVIIIPLSLLTLTGIALFFVIRELYLLLSKRDTYNEF